MRSAKRRLIGARPKKPRRAGTWGQICSAASASELFSVSFKFAAFHLQSADISLLLRTERGDLAGLGWVSQRDCARLRALLLRWVERPTVHRHRIRADQRAALLGLIGDADDWTARKAFVLSYLVDEAYAALVDDHTELHASVQRVVRPFLSEVANRPPPLGVMTPLAACRSWMRAFWFVGGTRKMDGFGPLPYLNGAALPSTVLQSLQRACDEDELRIGLVAWRSHTVAELTLATAPPGCFAVSGYAHQPREDLLRDVVLELHRAKTHIALLPEIALDAGELVELRSVLAARAARFPSLLVVGLTHQRASASHVNEAVVLDRWGNELFRHEKLEPFQYEGLLEDIVPRRSGEYRFADTPLGRLVVNVCRDVRSDLPMLLNRMLGTSLLLVPAYSRRLDFVLEEGRLLGARQSAITAAVNPPQRDLRDLSACYAPIMGRAAEHQTGGEEPHGEAAIQILHISREGGRGSLRAQPRVWV